MNPKITLQEFLELLSQAERENDIKGFFEICDQYPEAYEEFQIIIDQEILKYE